MDLNLTGSFATSKRPLGHPVQHFSSKLNNRVRKIPNSSPWGSCHGQVFLSRFCVLPSESLSEWQHSRAAGTQPVLFPG